MSEQLWIELPPISETAPSRLLVFLHGEGSSPEQFIPVALAWQLKFPGATGLVMQGLQERGTGHFEWYDPRGVAHERAPRVRDAAARLAQRLTQLQQREQFQPDSTVLVGFSQGANVVLEMIRSQPGLCGIAVAYAGRLSRPMQRGETVSPQVHLIHGGMDSLTPLVYARQALDGLQAAGASATLDVIEDASHGITQDMIILGTTRAMQTVFRHRRVARLKHLN